MPINRYFKGSGEKVMAGMMKEYGAKKGKQVFYATANKIGMKPMSHLPKNIVQSPSGDLGWSRQKESIAAGGFREGKTVKASRIFRGR
jgi:hypothetical protein